MSKAKAQPKAVIHRSILDEAENKPDASIGELASNVCGATPDLVERVLDDYGDPSEATPEEHSEKIQTVESKEKYQDLIDNLTNTQCKILKAIYENPSATQTELGKQFDVSGATICAHMSSIDGLEWSNREEFVEKVVPTMENKANVGTNSKTQNSQSSNTNQNMETNKNNLERNTSDKEIEDIKKIHTRLTQVEEKLDSNYKDSKFLSNNPDLIHKLLHICIKSDRISEEEEMIVIKEFI